MGDRRNRLALGTAQFGFLYGVSNQVGQVSEADAARIIGAARDAGLDTIDTAIGYLKSEERLGEVGISGWRVVTKLPTVPEDCADVRAWMDEAVDGSLRRLKIDRVMGLLLHHPRQLLSTRGDAIYAALASQKARAAVEKVGVSIYHPEELSDLCGRYDFDIIQAPFNVFDRRLDTSGWLARLKERGIEVHTRSAFLQGLLLMPSTERPSYFRQWDAQLSLWDTAVATHGGSASSLALNCPLSKGLIDRVVVGVQTAEQLAQLIADSDDPIPLVLDLPTAALDLIDPSRWPFPR